MAWATLSFGSVVQQRQSSYALPMPDCVKDVWEDPRKPHLVQTPPLIHTGLRTRYQVPRGDWAFLGPVHRPDDLLTASCSTKESKKGIPQLLGHCNLTESVAFLHDSVQAMAHAQQQVSHIMHAVLTATDVLEWLQVMLPMNIPQEAVTDLQCLATLHRFIHTVAEDSVECLTGLNLEVLHRVRPLDGGF